MPNYKQLSENQRHQIGALLLAEKNQLEIAEIVGCNKSTISRELKRNSRNELLGGKYDPVMAHIYSQYRQQHSRKRSDFSMAMKDQIKDCLENDQWSPEQIKGYCEKEGIEMVSTERIYQFIWEDKRTGGDLCRHLRRGQRRRRKRGNINANRGMIPGRVSIEQRPAIVERRSRIGDLELDTMIGKNHKGALLTIVDRKARFTLIKKLNTKTAHEVQQAMIALLLPYKSKIKTLTSDNGKEFTNHQSIAMALNAKFYFANPYHSWERGTNENTNGLIRQYFPKKTDFRNITDEQVKQVMNKLNSRPRKSLGFETPNQLFINNKKMSRVALVS